MDKFKYLTKQDLHNLRNGLLLTDRQKEIFNLKFEHGLSLEEISCKVNVSYSTAAHESSTIGKKIDKFLN